jgi:hypothetical protein
MQKKNVYSRLWDYGLVYEDELLKRISRGDDGRSGYEQVTDKTPNISKQLDFEFYDLVWWWDRPNKPNVNDEMKRLGRWLGVSHHVGSDLCYWIVTDSGQVVSKTSVEHVTCDDYLSEDMKAKVKEFEKKLEEHLDDSNFILQGEDGIDLKMIEDLDDEGIGAMVEDGITPMEEEYDDMIVEERPEANNEEAVDKYLNMELRIGTGKDDERWGRVIKHAKGIGGEPVSHAHANPFFDMREYEVKFTDGTVEQYATNIIAENMYAQVNDEGNMFQLLDEIMDHKKDDMAIDIANGTVTMSSGSVNLKLLHRDGSCSCYGRINQQVG